MLTKEQVLKSVSNGRKSCCLDSRDYKRLIDFFEPSEWSVFGFEPADDFVQGTYKVDEWTRERIVEALRKDVAFGFEKALSKRGISSSFMFECVKLWLWILEDPLTADYAMYGLPLYKAVAVKYGFYNPIGDDSGGEEKYDEDRWYGEP